MREVLTGYKENLSPHVGSQVWHGDTVQSLHRV